MPWSEKQTEQHIDAAQILVQIKDGALEFILTHPKTNEWEVKEFILDQYRRHNLKTYPATPIVAFNESIANPHYSPNKLTPKKLKPNTLIELDIWARLNESGAPFADITWMAFYGKEVPDEVQKVFDIVIEARDRTLIYIRECLELGNLPIGSEADWVARQTIIDAGFGDKFIHSTGHSIGTSSPHGRYAGLRRTNQKELSVNLGYTIEPGIYLPGRFGVRSEIDFYINGARQLIVTTPVQEKLVLVA